MLAALGKNQKAKAVRLSTDKGKSFQNERILTFDLLAQTKYANFYATMTQDNHDWRRKEGPCMCHLYLLEG